MSSDQFQRNQQLRARSTLVLLSHFPLSDSPTWVIARGLAYQPSVALVIMTLYQLYYIALDPFLGVSDAVSAPSPIASASQRSWLVVRHPWLGVTVRCCCDLRSSGARAVCPIVAH